MTDFDYVENDKIFEDEEHQVEHVKTTKFV